MGLILHLSLKSLHVVLVLRHLEGDNQSSKDSQSSKQLEVPHHAAAISGWRSVVHALLTFVGGRVFLIKIGLSHFWPLYEIRKPNLRDWQ